MDTGKRNTNNPEPSPSLCPQVQQAILMFKKGMKLEKEGKKKKIIIG